MLPTEIENRGCEKKKGEKKAVKKWPQKRGGWRELHKKGALS